MSRPRLSGYDGVMLETLTIPPRETWRTVRLGVVRFINTLPLIDGLEQLRDVTLHHSVPSLLIDMLLSDEVDVALCSSIDYQRSSQPLLILPVGLLGCHGPTLTVRLYSTLPLERIKRIYCDTDSHTSVVLLQILLREQYGISPELVDYDAREYVADNHPLEFPEAMMLIGDKVVTNSPPAVRYQHQLDLGEAWLELTGKPFVFALWMARHDADPASLRTASIALDHQRRHNQERLDVIIHTRVRSGNWPVDLAKSYLSRRITYQFDEAHLASLELFFDKAQEHNLIERRRPVHIFGSSGNRAGGFD